MTCEIDGASMYRKYLTDPKNIMKPMLYCYICPCCGASTIKENHHDRSVRLGKKSKSYSL